MSHLTNVSYPTIAFYVHHHGSGHIMRAITVATVLEGFSICFMGSNLEAYRDIIPRDIECIHLPLDLPVNTETALAEDSVSFLHYAPIGIKGIRERTASLTATFKDKYPILLIVDVSVEITLLARLCGVPVIVVKQHGKRDDLPHKLAYESAELLIAPFSAALEPLYEEEWIKAKTVHTGGFSRYSNCKTEHHPAEKTGNIAVLVGKGGTSIDSGFIQSLASTCYHYTFHIIGNIIPEEYNHADNIKWHGNLTDPRQVIAYCTVVIGNAGHNTVMEMADLNKRFICIPEERPFDEQLQKAAMLASNGHARVIQPAALRTTDWLKELAEIEKQQPDWAGVTDAAALTNIANAIKNTVNRVFKS